MSLTAVRTQKLFIFALRKTKCSTFSANRHIRVLRMSGSRESLSLASRWNKRAAAAQRLLFVFGVCTTIRPNMNTLFSLLFRPNRIRIKYSVQPYNQSINQSTQPVMCHVSVKNDSQVQKNGYATTKYVNYALTINTSLTQTGRRMPKIS